MPMPNVKSDDNSLSEELSDLISRMAKRRGSPQDRLTKELALSHHLTTCDDKFRILCRGEWKDDEFDYPAILAYNTVTKNPEVLIPSNPDNEIVVVSIHNFYSTIPHVGIAREVFIERTSTHSTI